MGTLEDARTAAAAANQVVTDLENEAPTPPAGGATEFTASAISNADGSVIVTLTPSAPAAVSETAESTGEPTGTVEATGDTGPQPTGQ